VTLVQNHSDSPGRITVTAPVRIADVGGWTDTWFAATGAVCNIAVGPAVKVLIDTVEATERSGTAEAPMLRLPDFGVVRQLNPEGLSAVAGAHPVLGEILRRHLDASVSAITIQSSVPPGSSLGTSGAVGVALIAGLFAVGQRNVDAHRIAVAAHEAETAAGLESGVQDHAASAHGGACLIDVNYPTFSVRTLKLHSSTEAALSARLRTVFLGNHVSSAIHRMVIDRIAPQGLVGEVDEFVGLRAAARAAAEALEAGDMHDYGLALDESVRLQRSLHPRLVSPAAERLVSFAGQRGGHAKVNGAGGDGGSVTLLAPDEPEEQKRFDSALTDLVAQLPDAALVSLQFSPSGVTVST
jgi:D-glycero-alpha-D-manno-heptose-7-phosphate kinase